MSKYYQMDMIEIDTTNKTEYDVLNKINIIIIYHIR